MSQIAPRELCNRYLADPNSIVLLDVRTPAEFKTSRIKFAINIPLDQLQPELLDAFFAKEREVCVICQSGTRSKKAAERLLREGFTHVLQVEGGMNGCLNPSLPVEKGRRGVSLERQVRITAGSLVVLGVVLSVIVHPYLIGISLFIGAGLVFSGVTDTCGMGSVLARMPWNR